MNVVNTLIVNYGVQKIPIKPFMSSVDGLCGSSNPAQRGEALSFYKECYRYIGAAIMPAVEKLKKAQQDELAKAFAEIDEKKEKAKPLRMTIREREAAKEAEIDQLCAEEENKIDAFDLAEEVDILSKYQDAWTSSVLELKKWAEKKEKLDELIADANTPKIKPGNTTPLVACLLKLITDSNINVSSAAVKSVGLLAKGLRKEFSVPARSFIAPLILKFREKKPSFIEELHEILDSLHLVVGLEEELDGLKGGFADKMPKVKQLTAQFLERAIQTTYIDPLKIVGKEVGAMLMKVTEDSNAEARDAALSCLGVLKGRLGESMLANLFTDVNSQKMAKINEGAQKVKPSKYDKSEKAAAKKKKEEEKAAPPPKKKTKKKEAAPAPPVEDVEMIQASGPKAPQEPLPEEETLDFFAAPAKKEPKVPAGILAR